MFLNCDRTAVSRAANSDLHSLRQDRSLELALHHDSHQLAHLLVFIGRDPLYDDHRDRVVFRISTSS